ncbi:hypothetical protein SteCoe_24292 [Stentor coeruleus]|uniref:UDP-N-acetylglucosamine--peptide N-acetylglucosaminyltransferase SPINDLY n=1 Tax=Stentor coeruleus TaxID=5963 RepID=A0A1R2BHW1_9CILI|nr:hypothetical protein SteCoe_24292 [Stentor coeruleus]
MSIRGFSPIVGIQAKPKHPIPQRPPKSVRTHSEKKFTPQINKSFTCYNDGTNQNNQSFTADKSRNISLAHLKSRNTSLGKYRNFRSITKLTTKEPVKKESSILLEKAKAEMKDSNYKSAINYLNKLIKEEPNNPDGLYLRGKCYINFMSYKEAIPDLLSLIQDYPLFEKNAYIALAMSFVALDDYTTAVRQLTKALIKFPKFKDAYLARGQLLTHQKIWDKAISDFYKVINLSPEDGNAYIGLADALIGMGDYQNSLKVLNSAAKCKNISNQAYLRRGKIFYELDNFKLAMRELNKAIKSAPLEAESYYYKALVQLNQDNLAEAALCLEQVVKYDTEKKFTGAAIYDLGAIKIKQKDYYGAMHTFQRATDTNVEIKQQKILVKYVESILTLMKRKFKDGTSLLTKIIKNNHPLIQEYIGNCFTFRGYAYAAQELHEKATKDLSTAAKMQKLDSASEYNYMISQGILLAEKKNDQAIAFFTKARELYSKNPETYTYEACIYFLNKNCDKCKDLLSMAIDLKPGDSDLHFFRGIVSYYEGKNAECVQDLEVAIEKSEDNNSYHYMCRGLSYAQLGLYLEAINDFSAVLQLNENLVQAFLYRGRCAFLQEDTNLAYADFQKLLYAKPEDPEVHINAGDLLMLTQCTEDAIKAYNNSLSKGKSKIPYIQKAKCNLILNKLSEAIQEISEALVLENDKKLLQDYNMLKSLEMCQDGRFNDALIVLQSFSADGNIVKLREIRKFIGICFFYLGEYVYAQTIFQSLLESTDTDTAETMYNLALCNLMAEYYESALAQLNELAYMTDGSERGKILLLSGFIHIGLDNDQEGKEFLSEAYKFDPQTVTQFLKSNTKISILAFNSKNDFCENFPLITSSIGSASPISIRLSFGLPLVEMPSMDFDIEDSILQQFAMKNIKCKPEAPWLNRVQGMIQFTDEVQDIVSETVTDSVAENSGEEEPQDDVFEDGTENFKKYRSALCLPRGGSDQILKNMQAVFANNHDDDSSEVL